jgi:RND family efflux transporter MFP subunit
MNAHLIWRPCLPRSLVLFALVLGATAGATPPASSARPVLTVQVVAPVSGALERTVKANGSLAAWQEASVGAEVQGLQIGEVRAQVGDVVQRGQVLAVLQSGTVRAELAQAEAALAEATATAAEAAAQAQRARSLQQQGFFSAAQLSQALSAEAAAAARVQSARALVQLQQQRLAQTEVRAPDAGTVSARQATVGSVVAPGQELFRLIRQGRLEWRAEVTAAELGEIRAGAPVRLTAASGQSLRGRVRVVGPSVDPQTRQALVYVDLQAPWGSARAGMFAQGEIVLGNSSALTVPQAAVVVRDGFSYVFSVGADQRVTQHKVQTGRLQGSQIEILSGLPQGLQLVASGGAFLNQGDAVRVAPATAAAR